MASMGPHRVKVDGKKDFEHVFACKASHRRFTLSISACINSTVKTRDLWKSISGLWGQFNCMCLSAPLKPERHHHVARSEDGRLFYDNKWYSRGQAICINRKDEYPIRCVCVYSYEWFHKRFCPWGWFIFKKKKNERKKLDFFFQGPLKMYHKWQ